MMNNNERQIIESKQNYALQNEVLSSDFDTFRDISNEEITASSHNFSRKRETDGEERFYFNYKVPNIKLYAPQSFSQLKKNLGVDYSSIHPRSESSIHLRTNEQFDKIKREELIPMPNSARKLVENNNHLVEKSEFQNQLKKYENQLGDVLALVNDLKEENWNLRKELNELREETGKLRSQGAHMEEIKCDTIPQILPNIHDSTEKVPSVYNHYKVSPNKIINETNESPFETNNEQVGQALKTEITNNSNSFRELSVRRSESFNIIEGPSKDTELVIKLKDLFSDLLSVDAIKIENKMLWRGLKKIISEFRGVKNELINEKSKLEVLKVNMAEKPIGFSEKDTYIINKLKSELFPKVANIEEFCLRIQELYNLNISNKFEVAAIISSIDSTLLI